MHLRLFAVILALLSASSINAKNVQLTDCGLLGPGYPMPANLGKSKAIQDAQKKFSSFLAQAVKNGTTTWGEFDSVNTSISVGVFSTQSDKLLAEFHHIGSKSGNKAHLTGGKLDGDTIYRTGSVGKMLSVYTFLAKLGPSYWSDPITKYIPELANVPVDNTVRNVNWSEITLGSLAGQMSGLPRDYALGDLSPTPGLTALGFPELKASEITTCGTIGLPNCSREEAIRLLLKQNPIAPSWQTPVYGSETYQLMAMAYENISGEPFAEAFRTGLVVPLGLKRTFWTWPGNDSNAVWADPKEANTWESSLGLENAAGGTWASLHDFAAIGRSVLRSSILPPYVTREWLKPNSHSNDPNSAVGKPWEIFGMEVPVSEGSKTTRNVYLYTKNGGIGGYNGQLILSPDHNIGIAVFVTYFNPTTDGAGSSTLWTINEMAVQTWITAAETAAREAAAANFVGTFASQDGLNSSISLAMVPNHQGVRIARLIYNNTDFLDVLNTELGHPGMTIQYTNLQDDGQLAFRGVLQSQKQQTSPSVVFQRDCNAYWTEVDTISYGGVGVDEFIITVDRNGKATGVEMPFLRTNFSKRVK
ncbi:hypothetical protein H2200_010699 [Cladophialophora chaetospira]|uniref:Beta-lactamase-related domain-containing protein n=1 Tax=Cladophialophora chaetospira TaxID=386627 RepID=A0AA38X0L5_9EURO|nr:hypothetical protein H2200_010699 [Cladophialophora chaetospira]